MPLHNKLREKNQKIQEINSQDLQGSEFRSEFNFHSATIVERLQLINQCETVYLTRFLARKEHQP